MCGKQREGRRGREGGSPINVGSRQSRSDGCQRQPRGRDVRTGTVVMMVLNAILMYQTGKTALQTKKEETVGGFVR